MTNLVNFRRLSVWMVRPLGRLAVAALLVATVPMAQAESLTDALRMATVIPADVIGMGDQLGAIKPGYVANLVRLDKSLMVRRVWKA